MVVGHALALPIQPLALVQAVAVSFWIPLFPHLSLAQPKATQLQPLRLAASALQLTTWLVPQVLKAILRLLPQILERPRYPLMVVAADNLQPATLLLVVEAVLGCLARGAMVRLRLALAVQTMAPLGQPQQLHQATHPSKALARVAAETRMVVA